MRRGRRSGRPAAPVGGLPLLGAGLAAAVLAAGSAACAGGTGAGGLPDVRSAPVTVRVESRYVGLVRIYIDRNGERSRLGAVSAWSPESFRVPPEYASGGASVRLIASPVGSMESVASEPFVARPGAEIHWTVTDPLEQARATLTVHYPGKEER